jgi:predicted anti-sigma-YlaC factor YlaD
MTECPHTPRVEDYLDGQLRAAEREAFRAHLAGCEACAAELTQFARVFSALREAPIWDPGPRLTERVLDHVLPSRLRRRWVTALGWSYSAVSSVCTFLFISWVMRPDTPIWLVARMTEAYERLIHTGAFTLEVLWFAAMQLSTGWGLVESLVARLAPVGRALWLPLGNPVIGAALWAAIVSCTLLVWWLKPRRDAVKEARHVDLLGF